MPHPPAGTWISSRFFTFPRMQRPVMARKKTRKTTRPTFYRWLRSGRLKGMKVGRQWRFRREDLDRFLAGKEPDVHLTADIKPLLGALAKRIQAAGDT